MGGKEGLGRVNKFTILVCCRVFLPKNVLFVSILDFLCPIARCKTENWPIVVHDCAKGNLEGRAYGLKSRKTLTSCLQFRLIRRFSIAVCSNSEPTDERYTAANCYVKNRKQGKLLQLFNTPKRMTGTA